VRYKGIEYENLLAKYTVLELERDNLKSELIAARDALQDYVNGAGSWNLDEALSRIDKFLGEKE